MTKPNVNAVIGIDPGGKTTAIVALVGGEMEHHLRITRPANGDLNKYALEVASIAQAIIGDYCDPAGGPIVGIEQINRPNPHVNRRNKGTGKVSSIINPQGAMDTSRIIGALVVALHSFVLGDIRMIEPRRHGQGDLEFYPAELVGARETTGTGGILRHERSAFDIAHATRNTYTREKF